jgi:hypothetical protein
MNTNDSQLVIHDVPILLWIFGLIFGGVGILMVIEGGAPLPMVLIFLGVGFGFLLFTSALTITADRITRTVKLQYRSILLRSRKEVAFDEIAGINIERSSGSKGGSTYRLTLVRKDGQVVPFRSFSSSGWQKKEKWAGQLREFIGIQDLTRTSPGVLPTELAQGDIRETNGVYWQIQPMTTQGANAPTGARWHSLNFKTPGVFLFIAQKAEGPSSTGFLASLGSMFVRQALSIHGFQPADTPGLEEAATLSPLDPALEPHFMAYTNSPDSARRLLNSNAAAQLASWAGRYPIQQFGSASNYSQLMTLFGPNGVYLVMLHLRPPSQANELVALGVELVKSQGSSVQSASAS